MPTLTWTAPPAPWIVGDTPYPQAGGYDADVACGVEWEAEPPIVAFATGAVFVAAEQTPAGSQPSSCGAAVLQGGRWTLFPLPAHSRINAAAVLPGGGFVVGTAGTTGVGASGGGPGGLFVYADGSLAPVAIPAGQFVDSLLALPAGGYAVGTAPVTVDQGEKCGATACPHGAIGLASAAGSVRWFTPPAPGSGPVYGTAPFDPPYGVVVGDVQGDLLWFGVDGVGVAALNTATGKFTPGTEATGDTYLPGAGGPLQFFAGSATTVYYSVHRLPGVADAGYWGPLYTVHGGGAATSLFPATLPGSTTQVPKYGCIERGVGAPSAVHVFGGRVWVQWSGCQVYEAPAGAGVLNRPAPACSTPAAPSGPSSFDVVYGSGTVSELCVGTGGATLYEFNAETAAITASYRWKAVPWGADGGPAAFFAGPGGDLWTWSDAILMQVTPAGAVAARYAFPGPDGAAAEAHRLWLLGSQGVASVPAG